MDELPENLLDTGIPEGIIERVVAEAAARIVDAHGSKEGLDVSRAWIDKDSKHAKKVGWDKASWVVYWIDPDGRQRSKSCGPGVAGRTNANKLQRQVEAQLLTGTYQKNTNKLWAEFLSEYTDKILSGKAASTRRQALMSLENFARLVKPRKVSAVRTATIDDFIRQRRAESKRLARLTEEDFTPYVPKRGPMKGQQIWKRTCNGRIYHELPGSEPAAVTEASVNADLRNLKAALCVAKEWGYLVEMPVVRMLKEPKKLPRYVLPEDFARLYAACEYATLPDCQGITPADWWRALLVFIYQATGWRIGQCLALLREDVDLDAGTAIARAVAEGNKARTDRLVRLHPVAMEHLRRIPGFTPEMFPWPNDRRTLSAQLGRLCQLAGVPAYGWHNLRKGFGTLNAPRLAPTELQHLMQHASLATTQKYYVNPMAAQDEAVAKLFIPPGLTGTEG